MYRNFLQKLEPYGLTPFHYLVLCCLWQQDGLSSSEIADKLKQLGATLTGVVDRMEKRDLVYRKRNVNDRRVVQIWLTEEGKNLMNVLPLLGEESITEATKGMSEQQRKNIIEMLDQIVLNLS